MPSRLTVPISLLDRARTREGEEPAAALRAAVDRAQRAEQLGYHRFWVAEHHAVPGIAGSAPAVLLAAIGARTSRIRLGTGGIMLANHQPIVVAEQALALAGLFTGRVDVGLGRSLGFTQPVREALQVTSYPARTFSRDIAEVRAYLHGEAPVTATPATSTPPPIYVLATRQGLTTAAELGLPVVVGGPSLRGALTELTAYRRDFAPSAQCPEPQVIISVDVMVAASRAQARDLLLPEAISLARSRTTGSFAPLRPVPDGGLTEVSAKERAVVAQQLQLAVYGTAAEVAGELGSLVSRTGATEVLATTSTYDHGALAAADTALAELAG
ncbi:MsnO8 family LLM class oxidoreductase [Georgenia sp. MJ170]|uniref:MsnO8 family LLM class oxidoreductase n=1 Tax=Georgenia sunbinii TaxID=3117728 RepID=UPI002F2660D9